MNDTDRVFENKKVYRLKTSEKTEEVIRRIEAYNARHYTHKRRKI